VKARIGSEQWEWLRRDLLAVDRLRTPWVVFGGHRPGYIDSNHASKNYNGNGDLEVMALWIKHVEPLLIAAKVDFAVWGHNHAVQRLCASRGGLCIERSSVEDGVHVYHLPPATVHLVVGVGGASFTKNDVGADFTEKVFHKWGFAHVIAHNRTHLDWRFLDNGANDDSLSSPGRVLDAARIIRQDHAAIFSVIFNNKDRL